MNNWEQKYKGLVAKIKNAHLYAQTDSTKNVLENILPELAESEDEKVRKEIIRFIRMEVEDEIVGNKWLAWLEKQGEQKFSYTTLVETGNGGINALVTKELPTNGCDDEQNPAWSEEDERHLNTTIAYLKDAKEFKKTAEDCTDWLKSLKDRVQPIHEYSDTEKQEIFLRSQRPHFWRPSNVQMKALKYVAYHLMPDSNYRKEMFSLYEDLKKLTE